MRDSQDNPKVLVEETAEEATALASELFKSIICEAVDEEGICYLALAGGTTPYALYEQLARSCASGEVPWEQVQVFFGDERNVPQDHVESNYRMVQRTLLDHVPVQPTQVHPMPADSDQLDDAAAEYESLIRQLVPSEGAASPQFDLVLLGMGGDGHVASIFPGTDSVAEEKKLIAACFVPVLGRNRMTFTFPLINAARNVLLLVTGQDKAEAVGALLGDDPNARERLPAARIAPNGLFTVVLDAPAAKLARLKAR
ncbi:MAG: 6-phosphogluconolactonase [Planctomycetota bacterium]